MKTNSAILILAAGSSSRMKTPKQLLIWNNTSFLDGIIQQSLASKFEKVVVVLGANSVKIKAKVNFENIEVIENKEWQKGIGNSISCGVNFIQNNFTEINSVLITLADQPFLTSDYFNQLGETFLTSEKRIVASKIKNRLGVPAIFDSYYFKELKNLDRDSGAKKLISTYKNDVEGVISEIDFTDIDTQQEYKSLLNNNSK